MSQALFLQPDWVMLGVKVPDDSMPEPEGMAKPRVMVIASQTLTQAELRAALEHVDWDWSTRPGSFIKSYEMSAYMRDVVMAYGADYAEAMRTIFERWSPDASARNNREGLHNIRPAAIGSGPAELMP